MSLRPATANWFEVLVLRDDLTTAIDTLARSSRVELESHGESHTPLLMPECREMLGEFDELLQRYERYWPTPRHNEPDERLEPQQMLRDAMRRLRAWTSEASLVVQRIEKRYHCAARNAKDDFHAKVFQLLDEDLCTNTIGTQVLA